MPIELDFWADSLNRASNEIDVLEDQLQFKGKNINGNIKEHIFSIFEKNESD